MLCMHNNVSWIIEYQALSHLLLKNTKQVLVHANAMGIKSKENRLRTTLKKICFRLFNFRYSVW